MFWVGQVSWLEAARLAFPGIPPQWLFRVDVPNSFGPLTVAGPRRILTGFRDDPPAEWIHGDGPQHETEGN